MLYDANKIVELNRNGVNNIEAGSWRKQLSTIMNNHSGSAAKIADSANWGNTLDVNPNIDLLLTSVPELSYKNNYNTWVQNFLSGVKGGGSNKNSSGFIEKIGSFIKAAGGAIDLISAAYNTTSDSSGIKTSQTFSPWVQNVQAWKADDAKGIEITTSFSFAMGQYGLWNAREEVVKPLLNLVAPTLIQNLNSYSMSGPTPNTVYLLANLVADATSTVAGAFGFKKSGEPKNDDSPVQDSTANINSTASATEESNSSGFLQLASDGLNKLATSLEDFVLDSFKSYTFTVQFGKFLTLNNMMIKDSKLQFSDQVDQYGYPIEGSCTLTMQGIIPIALTTSNVNTLAAKFGS